MTHLITDGKSRNSAKFQLVKTVLVLVFPLGGPFRVQLSIMPFECLGVVGEGHMSGLPSTLGQL